MIVSFAIDLSLYRCESRHGGVYGGRFSYFRSKNTSLVGLDQVQVSNLIFVQGSGSGVVGRFISEGQKHQMGIISFLHAENSSFITVLLVKP